MNEDTRHWQHYCAKVVDGMSHRVVLSTVTPMADAAEHLFQLF